MHLPHYCTRLFVSALLAVGTPSLMLAAPQAPLPAVRAQPGPKAAAKVQALIDKGHTAQGAKPARLEEAERLYNEALIAARALEDKPGESAALRNLGNLRLLRGKAAEALERYNQSLAVARAAGDKYNEAGTLFNIAQTVQPTQPARAIELGEQVRALYHELGLPKDESQTLSFVGAVLRNSGQFARARACFEQAAALARTAGASKEEADAYWYLASAAWAEGKADVFDPKKTAEAKLYFEKALPLYRKVGDAADEAWTADLLGNIGISQGSLDQARRYFEQALGLYRSVQAADKVAGILVELSNVASLQERLLDSLGFSQEALDLFRKLGNHLGEATQLRYIGDLYTRFGQQKTGLQAYLKALPLYEQAGDVQNQVVTLNSIGQVYEILGDRKTGLEYYKRSIPLLEKPAEPLVRLQNLGLLARIYYAIGNYEKTRDTLLQQRVELEKSGFQKSGIGSALPSSGILAIVEQKLGHTDRALELLHENLQQTSLVGNGLSRASTLDSIAEIEQEKGDLEGAEGHFAQAVGVLETVRASLSGLSQAKSTFLNANIGVYQDYLALLLKRNKLDAAFNLAQKMKARALLDILYDGKVELSASLTPEEREQERKLRQKSDMLNTQLVKEGVRNEIGSKKRAEAIRAQIDQTERELQVLQDRLYARHPGLAQKRAATTITLSDVAKFLPEDTALLEYLVLRSDKTNKVVLFVATQHAGKPSLTVHELPISDADLRPRLDALNAACSDPRKEYRASAADLYAALVAPAQSRLGGIKKLIVCPDGPLWDAPFAALMTRSSGPTPEFLIDRYEIDYAYSGTGAAAALADRAARRHKAPAHSMLAFADPDFGGDIRFGDNPDIPGQRPINAASRPISAASRPISAASRRVKTPSRPIGAASRPISAASRPISAASRPIAAASRPIGAASRPIGAASRPIGAASRAILLPRGGKLSQLPGTRLEARAIQADFKGARVFMGAAAQEAVAKREAGRYQYLHFATHGFFNDAAPLLSAIVLALPDGTSDDDGFLTAREIFDLNLNADMVVLSACNTARGEKRSGEGIIGLTWALFAAGAPTQVVSQWSVSDDSTAALMQRFYANLTERHLPKGAALRQAALSVRNGAGGDNPKSKIQSPKSNWSHPYYWAPFILMGDWR